MAQQDKSARLVYLYKNYKNDIDEVWIKYTSLCKENGVSEKAFLTDASLYAQEEHLGITSKIEEEIADKFPAVVEAAKDAKKRKILETAAAKKPTGTCQNCGAKEFLEVGCGVRYSGVTLPSGLMLEREESIFTLPGICQHENLEIKICIKCGTLANFDSKKLSEAIQKLENEKIASSD